MSDQAITDLLREAPFSFVGTVEHVGEATMEGVPTDERTAVVRVEHVLHAPSAFASLDGQRITMQLREGEATQEGERAAFFARGLAFGESIAVTEVGRLPVEQVEPHIARGMAAGEAAGFGALERQVELSRLREHAEQADAVVVGRVVGLENVLEPAYAEHNPDWWRATIEVEHVDKGDVTAGRVGVLYANSLDVQWRTAPKPKAAQEGLWILHATEGDLRETAPYQILHPEDFQPVQNLDELRGNES